MVQKSPATMLAFSPLSILRMLWKRKLPIGLVWVAVSIAAVVLVSRIPSVYRAEALILVDSQKIPDRYVASSVVSDAQDRLATISQQILSSDRLQKIIESFDLYHNSRQNRFVEEILAIMRQDIEITPEKTWTGRTASFRVSYRGPDPSIVAQVTNKIASLYVEENLKAREIQAEGTSEFIETQLKEAKQKLDELEAAVSQYKLHHNGELPQQEGSLNGILSRLGTALEANRDAINRAQQQKAILQDALSIAEESAAGKARDLQTAAAAAASSSAPAIPGLVSPKPRKRSEDLQAQLVELTLRYSDSHPDVRRLRLQIEQARQDEKRSLESAPEAPVSAGAGTPAVSRPRPVLDSPELAQTRERIVSTRSQLVILNQELENRKKDQQRILSDINLYQGRMNSLPIREQEMSGLTRDYEITKANYRSLLDKKIAAEMSTDMERREKSERFTIVDPARIPAKPVKPNRLLLSIEGSLFGLVLGLVLGLGREFQESTVLGEWELPAGLTVLGRLPYIELATPEYPTKGRPDRTPKKRNRKLKLAVVSSALVSLLGAIVAGIYFAAHRF